MVGTANFADVPARIGRTGERVAGANDAAEAAQAKSKRARIGERGWRRESHVDGRGTETSPAFYGRYSGESKV